MKSLFTSTILCLLSALAIGQATGNYMYNISNRWSGTQEQVQLFAAQPAHVAVQQHQLNLTTKALFNAKATSFLAILHVTQVGPTARAVDSLMMHRIDGFKQEIFQHGLDEDDVFTDMLSLVPIFEIEKTGRLFSKTYNEVPAGFEMQKNIHVRFKDAEMLDRIVTAAAFEEIYDLVKVEYFVDNIQAIYDSLRVRTTALMHERLEQFADIGVAVEDQWLVAGDQKGMYQPQDRYKGYKAFTNTSIEAAVRKGQVTQMKRPSTHYYEKLPYNEFDIIANAEILEPVVQFTYSLTVQVELKRPEVKPEPEPEVRIETKTRYFLLDQEGQIKPLELHD